MKIKNLRLANFRRFEGFEINLDDSLTVLVASNGYGKTTVLDAIAISLGSFVGEFSSGRAIPINKNDARIITRLDTEERISRYPVEVGSTIEVGCNWASSHLIPTKRVLPGAKRSTSTKESKRLRDWAVSLIGQVMDEKDPILPVVAFYGTGRLLTKHKETAKRWLLTQDRTTGYEQCLSSRSNFQQVQQWMKRAALANKQKIESNDSLSTRFANIIQSVESSVNEVLACQGLTDCRFDISLDELSILDQEGVRFPISQLSDGFQAMVALTADLAYRCARLNPSLGDNAPRKTNGIVLIDEIELHLHPAWQQVVVDSLIDAFPAIQFIVTTHSPQIVSTIKRESLRILQEVIDPATGFKKSEVIVPDLSPYGHEAGLALSSVFGVSQRPPIEEITDELGKYYQLLRSDSYTAESAQAVKDTLTSMGYQFSSAEEQRAALLLRHFKQVMTPEQ